MAAFFVGRASVGTPVEAGAPESNEVEGGRVVEAGSGSTKSPAANSSPAAAGNAESLNPAERALLDPRNRYTVKLVEYQKGRDDSLAMQTLSWLQGQNLPAVAQFQGKRLYILLGAGENQAALDELLSTAKSMTGPPPLNKPTEFHDAYVVSIDRLIQR